MAAKLYTFHNVIAACEEASREGWQKFLGDYTPIFFALYDLYLGTASRSREELWRGALTELARNNFERLRHFEHQAEREFLADLRDDFLERGRAKLDPGRDSAMVPRPTPESARGLLKGLPLTHQEVLFFKLAGYSDASLEKALVITPAVAAKGLERLSADYAAVLGRNEDRCLWPAAWAEVLRFARGAKQESCPPLRQFVRIHDGGSSWDDKEPAEQHAVGCMHCLERWTALREIKHWRREARRLDAAETDAFLSTLPVRGPRKTKKSFLARMFG